MQMDWEDSTNKIMDLWKVREKGQARFTENNKFQETETEFEKQTGGKTQLVGMLPRIDQLHLTEKIVRTANNYPPEGHGFVSGAMIQGRIS